MRQEYPARFYELEDLRKHECPHLQLNTSVARKERRAQPLSLLTVSALRQFGAFCRSLQWAAVQLRVDHAFEVSTLQAEVTQGLHVRSLLYGNKIVSEHNKCGDWALEFGPVGLDTRRVVAISDAALGNVDILGGLSGLKVRSQGGFIVLPAEKPLQQSGVGRFGLLDYRLGVVRSSYAAELLALDDGIDSGEVFHGYFAELRGRSRPFIAATMQHGHASYS